MLISAILFSALCVDLSTQYLAALRMTVTPESLTPGKTKEVTLHCYWDFEHGSVKPSDGRLASLVISKNLYTPNTDIAGISLADENTVILNETLRPSVTYQSGRLTQAGLGTELTITLDTTTYDVLGHYTCQGYFLDKFGNFRTLSTDYIHVTSHGPILTPSPRTVTSDRADPLTLTCDVSNTGNGSGELWGTLVSIIIIKMNEDPNAEHHDLAGVTMLHRNKVKVADTARSFVTGQSRLNDEGDLKCLEIQVIPTAAPFQLPGIYKCKAMFISKIGHVTTKLSEATVTLDTSPSRLQSAFAAVDPAQVGPGR